MKPFVGLLTLLLSFTLWLSPVYAEQCTDCDKKYTVKDLSRKGILTEMAAISQLETRKVKRLSLSICSAIT